MSPYGDSLYSWRMYFRESSFERLFEGLYVRKVCLSDVSNETVILVISASIFEGCLAYPEDGAPEEFDINY